ncbi:replication-relaxation family protein [Microbacterium testaceum]|uniref:replication-relaxation family protein n=1 Tax=Microbacterium testaceum TaxID=2033 RepID=UPI0007345A89|nr:replication-relaxation family protein [Microbacterium testaceum]
MTPTIRPSSYVTSVQLRQLRSDLSERDWALLRFLSRHCYATTKQLQRQFFTGHATPSAATRATVRVLDRLLQQRLITRLERKIGGHTRGSASYIWHLDAAGERITRRDGGPRRRFIDPSLPFLEHCLQITETAVILHELTQGTNLRLTKLEIETEAWRSFLTGQGTTTILKPDLFATLSTPEFDDHWYVEVDLGTESVVPVLRDKCAAYAAYRATGRAQAEHGVFPRVLWIVPTQRRADRLTATIHADKHLPDRLFTVITPQQLPATIADPDSATPTESREEES